MISTFGCNNGLISVGGAGLLRDGARQSVLCEAGELHSTYAPYPALALIVQAVWTACGTLGHVNDLLTTSFSRRAVLHGDGDRPADPAASSGPTYHAL